MDDAGAHRPSETVIVDGQHLVVDDGVEQTAEMAQPVEVGVLHKAHHVLLGAVEVESLAQACQRFVEPVELREPFEAQQQVDGRAEQLGLLLRDDGVEEAEVGVAIAVIHAVAVVELLNLDVLPADGLAFETHQVGPQGALAHVLLAMVAQGLVHRIQQVVEEILPLPVAQASVQRLISYMCIRVVHPSITYLPAKQALNTFEIKQIK